MNEFDIDFPETVETATATSRIVEALDYDKKLNIWRADEEQEYEYDAAEWQLYYGLVNDYFEKNNNDRDSIMLVIKATIWDISAHVKFPEYKRGYFDGPDEENIEVDDIKVKTDLDWDTAYFIYYTESTRTEKQITEQEAASFLGLSVAELKTELTEKRIDTGYGSTRKMLSIQEDASSLVQKDVEADPDRYIDYDRYRGDSFDEYEYD